MKIRFYLYLLSNGSLHLGLDQAIVLDLLDLVALFGGCVPSQENCQSGFCACELLGTL